MVTTVDGPVAGHWRADLAEQVMGVEPLDGILEQLRTTRDEYAQLWSLHGPGNGWDTQRKALWCVLATEIRDAAATANEKITEAAIEQRAHAHPKYRRFLDDGIVTRARFAQLESERDALVMRANRGQALLRVNVPMERGG